MAPVSASWAEERSRDELQPAVRQVGAALPADWRRPANAAGKTSAIAAAAAITPNGQVRRALFPRPPGVPAEEAADAPARLFMLCSHRRCETLLLETKRSAMKKTDVWQGTLALMVLKTLNALGPQHGYGI